MAGLSDEQRKSLNLATERYAQYIDRAAAYLERRGIDRATAHTRRLGIVADPIPGHEARLGRLAIPYNTQAGVVNMQFRCIRDHNCKEIPNHKKYLTNEGLEFNLYGVTDAFKPSLDICFQEGEIDTITLSEMVGLPSLGNPGVDKWRPWWTTILKDFRRVYCFMDGDEAGEKMGLKVQKEVGMAAVLIKLPPGEDVNSCYVKYGPQYLLDLAKDFE